MTSTAEERVLRTIGLLFGVAGAIFGLLTAPAIVDQFTAAPLWWTTTAVVATVGLPVLLGALAPWARVGVLRRVALAVAAGNLLALLTAPLVYAPSGTAAASPWVLQLTALGTTASAFGLPTAIVTGDVVLTGVLVAADRTWTESRGLTLIPLQDGLYALLFCAVFAALAVSSLRAGRSVDAAARIAADAVRTARDERVRADERARVNALVHDHVLTTLLVASRNASPEPAASREAAEALDQLHRLVDLIETPGLVDDAVLIDRLRAQSTSVLPEAELVVEGAAGPALPETTVDTLVGAAGEALRNARRHAGAGAAVEVHVRLGVDVVEIAVIDDGRGFSLDAVPANRLGIAASIIGRLHIIGGTAEVRSRPGRGTAVMLRWPRR